MKKVISTILLLTIFTNVFSQELLNRNRSQIKKYMILKKGILRREIFQKVIIDSNSDRMLIYKFAPSTIKVTNVCLLAVYLNKNDICYKSVSTYCNGRSIKDLIKKYDSPELKLKRINGMKWIDPINKFEIDLLATATETAPFLEDIHVIR